MHGAAAMWRLTTLSALLGASTVAGVAQQPGVSSAAAEALAGALGEDEVCLPGGGESPACALQAIQHSMQTRLAAPQDAELLQPRGTVKAKGSGEEKASDAAATALSPGRQAPSAAAVGGAGATASSGDDEDLDDPLIISARYLAGTLNPPGGLGPQFPEKADWVSKYEVAQKKWAKQGEALPMWMEDDGMRLVVAEGVKARASWIAPVSGSAILIFAISALVAGRRMLDRIRDQEDEQEEAEGSRSALEMLRSAPDSRLPGEQPQEEGDSVTGDSSTRAPSEQQEGEAEPAAEGKPVSIWGLYRFAPGADKVRVVVACLCSIVHGACMPVVFYNLDKVFNALYLPNDDGTMPPVAGAHTDRDNHVMYIAKIYFFMAIIVACARTSAIMCMAHAVDTMSQRVRAECFKKLLSHGPSWHDTHNANEITTKFAQDGFYHKEGCGEQMVNAVRAVALFFSAITCAMFKDWQMACVMSVALPVAGFAAANAITMVRDFSSAQNKVYVKAGGIAETALQLIKTVTAFNGQSAMLKSYEERLDHAAGKGTRIGVVQGFSMGVTMCVVGAAISIGMYAGSIWVLEGYERRCWDSAPPFGSCRTGGTMLSAMFTVLWGFTQGIGTLVVTTEVIAQGKGAAQRLYAIIDEPLEQPVDGLEPAVCEGHISFENVRFSYPGRQAAVALYSVTLRVEAGKTAALVGMSGSGKSTIVSLLLRFYEPQAGTITMDGVNIRQLDLRWLRSKMALVDQEPVLFGTTIGENVAYGADRKVTADEVERACKMANAHNFIRNFPDMYETTVGERGAQLSGGQKQRIAIARALIRDPSILLLDEATSALDTESERIVQEALDTLLSSKKRTTMIIAHRLTTVQAADTIFVMKEGHIMEQGTHTELLKNSDSIYATLVKRQLGTDGPKVPKKRAAVNDSQESGSDDTDEAPAAEKLLEKAKAHATQDHVAATKDSQVSVWRLWRLSHPEWPLYALGTFATLCVSAMTPMYAMRFAQSMNLFNRPPVTLDESHHWVPDFSEKSISHSINNLVFTMQMIGVFTLAAATFQQYCFHKAGEAFTARLRSALFASLLKQDMAFFDQTTAGSLTGILATDIPNLKQLVGFSLASVVQSTLGIVTSFSLAMYMSWRFTLCVMACLPLLILAPIASEMALRRQHPDESPATVTESVTNIRTVAAFGLEQRFIDRLNSQMRAGSITYIWFRFVGAAGTGTSSGALFLIYGLTVIFANIFINDGTMAPDRAMMSLFLLFSSIAGLTELSRWAEKTTEARKSASTVFEVMDKESGIDAFQEEGLRPSKVVGRVEFEDVHFRYPTRPDVQVFQGFSLAIEANTTVALVGSSGSGKSTVVGLLQRFYDPVKGVVKLDGNDTRKLNVRWLRSQMGLVQQEPVLFGGSIQDNIAYGLEGASEEAVLAAAKMANAHSFVSTLPDQYNTSVGGRGAQLSGGQKQRIAIARALIRDPPLLLLDEATSALDTESERIVQEALDSLLESKARTTIVIAHRLSTIKNADVIAVVDKGCVAEQGTHDELIAKGAIYAKLVGRQSQDGKGETAAPAPRKDKKG